MAADLSELYDQKKDGTGHYCCPVCLFWYDTNEEKQLCMTERHGYETLNISPIALRAQSVEK